MKSRDGVKDRKQGNKFMNYVGQIRLYSLVDLVLLVVAIRAGWSELAGVVLLHVGFLLYLESNHKHSYRADFPKYLWVVLIALGIFFYAHWTVIGFLVFSYLYTMKKVYPLGVISPFSRALQYCLLVIGIIGFGNLNTLTLGIFGLIVFRNFAGDLRDVVKDNKEGIVTLPIVLGFRRDFKSVHFFVLLLTSLIWWYLAQLSIGWLVLVYAVQLLTYNMTPR